ncbi:MAG: tetratricopeptide repeat protein [Candidatus Eisenbacteria bacterium]|nr:tetratricopeptide repeat protein [Candidatus Eisenbacteria bacterium]
MSSSSTKEGTLQGRRVAISGRLSSMKREQALSFLEMVGASFDRTPNEETNYLVVGEGVSTLNDEGHPTVGLRAAQELRAAGVDIQIVSETEFLALLGLGELLRLFTSQQLSRILGVPRRELDSWVRRGLIRPIKIVNRLHYFDFAQVVSAKRLQDLIGSGVPLARIRSSLEEMQTWLPGTGKSLVQLGILEQDGRLVVRLPDGAIAEATGQLQIPLGGTGIPDGSYGRSTDASAALSDSDGPSSEGNGPVPEGDVPSQDHGSSPELVGSPGAFASRNAEDAPAGDAAPSDAAPGKASGDRAASIVQFPEAPWRRREEDETPSDGARSPEAESWFEQATELEETGKLEEAASAYQKALAVDGPAADVSFNLGNVLYSLGRKNEAIQRFLQSVEIDPGYIEAWNNLATAYFETNRPEEAVRSLRKALAVDPTYADAHYNLGEVLHFLGRDDDARAHWAAYLRQDPSSDWAEHVRQRLRELNR